MSKSGGASRTGTANKSAPTTAFARATTAARWSDQLDRAVQTAAFRGGGNPARDPAVRGLRKALNLSAQADRLEHSAPKLTVAVRKQVAALRKQATTEHDTAIAQRDAQATMRAATRLAGARNASRLTRGRTSSLFGEGTPATRAVAAEARRIAPSEREHQTFLDRQTGATRFTKVGGRTSVGVTGEQGRQYAVGSIDLHNHPFNNPDRYNYPTFSDRDYQDYANAVRTPHAGVVVTSRGIATIMPRAGSGTAWPSYGRVVKPALDRHFDAIDKATFRAIRSGRIPAGVTAGDIMHLAWRRAARETGLTYLRQSLPRGVKASKRAS